MRTTALLTLSAALTVLGAASAGAQSAMPAPTPPQAAQSQAGGPVNPPTPGAPAASDAASPVVAVAQDPSAPLGSNANPIPQSSPTPPAQASTLLPNDPSVVSNGPVPDTKANRAKYGQPLSAAGRSTKPAGN
jgi:hypothetical protein